MSPAQQAHYQAMQRHEFEQRQRFKTQQFEAAQRMRAQALQEAAAQAQLQQQKEDEAATLAAAAAAAGASGSVTSSATGGSSGTNSSSSGNSVPSSSGRPAYTLSSETYAAAQAVHRQQQRAWCRDMCDERCAMQPCSREVRFGPRGQRALYCRVHKLSDMPDVRGRCMVDGCARFPLFTEEGMGMYCIDHLPDCHPLMALSAAAAATAAVAAATTNPPSSGLTSAASGSSVASSSSNTSCSNASLAIALRILAGAEQQAVDTTGSGLWTAKQRLMLEQLQQQQQQHDVSVPGQPALSAAHSGSDQHYSSISSAVPVAVSEGTAASAGNSSDPPLNGQIELEEIEEEAEGLLQVLAQTSPAAAAQGSDMPDEVSSAVDTTVW
jgi:hypothetical protein